ncbi:MAG TPA: protein kinase [Gemmatimonadaceae bacterium]|nr:protein kinase [Gemmatimonadaceae bacterium]
MSDDALIAALRANDAPFVVDGDPLPTPLGRSYPATSTDSSDGRRIVVTHLAPALARAVGDTDALLHVLSRHAIGGGSADGTIYFVEARPEGEPITARLAREGPMRSEALRPIAVRAAEALRTVQATHGPHGLVSPDSLLVAADGTVAFRWNGLFAALRAGGVPAEAIAAAFGEGLHFAPELRRGEMPTNASDVFALGTTLYEALTGRPPFGGRTTATVMATVLTDGSSSGHKPPALTRAILRAIEQQPGDRWVDARQFADALEEEHTTAPRPRPRRRRILPVAAAAVGIGALLLWWLID